MDKEIKKDKINIKDKDVDGLKEYNSISKPKVFYTDKRTDESYFNNVSIEENYFEDTSNRRPSYPWEDEFIKDKPLTTEQQKEYDSQYNTEERFYQGETSKKIVKRTAKYKSTKDAFNLELNPNIQRTPSVGNPRPRAIRYDYFSNTVVMNNNIMTTSNFDFSNTGKHDYTKTSYPNGWPLSLPSNTSERTTVKIPGIKSSFVVRDITKPIFFNFIYDFHNTVESVNTLVPEVRGKNFEETKKLAESGKVKMISGDGSYIYRKVRDSKSKWSAHASATAIDINWNFHWLYWRNTFTPSQISQIKILTKKYGLTWGGEYVKRADEMHFEIKVSPDNLKKIIEENGLVKRMNDILNK